MGIENFTSEVDRGTDVDCHKFTQTFRLNLEPSSVVDQKSTWHGDLYTQTGEEGTTVKNVGGKTGGCVCFTKSMWSLRLIRDRYSC